MFRGCVLVVAPSFETRYYRVNEFGSRLIIVHPFGEFFYFAFPGFGGTFCFALNDVVGDFFGVLTSWTFGCVGLFPKAEGSVGSAEPAVPFYHFFLLVLR